MIQVLNDELRTISQKWGHVYHADIAFPSFAVIAMERLDQHSVSLESVEEGPLRPMAYAWGKIHLTWDRPGSL